MLVTALEGELLLSWRSYSGDGDGCLGDGDHGGDHDYNGDDGGDGGGLGGGTAAILAIILR